MVFATLFAFGCHIQLGSTGPASTIAPSYVDGPVPLPGQDFTVPMVVGSDGEPLVIASVPPGSLVTFADAETQLPTKVFVRRHVESGAEINSGEDLWEIAPEFLSPPGRNTNNAQLVGFVVPALPKGNYDLWYTGGRAKAAGRDLLPRVEADATQWMSLQIRPTLKPERALVRGLPGSTVEVAVGFHGPVVAGQAVEVRLSQFSSTVRLAPGQRDTAAVGQDRLARFDVRLLDAADLYLAATANGYDPVAIRVVVGPEMALRDHRLQPGDVLLCQGHALISHAIQLAERLQLGRPNPHERPWYSHVALYLGDGRTVEMLDGGREIHTLEETASGCTTLDVYRRDGITAKEREVVVASSDYGRVPYAWGQIAAIASMAVVANTDRVRLSTTTSRWEQFWGGVKASVAKLSSWVLRGVVTFVTGADEGRSRMICSELVAWSYHDSEVALDVAPWWPIMQNTDSIRTLNGRMDFTTPNMIAQSSDVSYQFQLYPQVPPEVAVGDCEVQLTEKIEFESGSTQISEGDADLLEAVVIALADHAEIQTVRIEGNTDDVGSDADNLDLSQRRAQSVADWLVEHGIAAERVSSLGRGEGNPIVTNEDAAGRHKNRRVEFRVEGVGCERPP